MSSGPKRVKLKRTGVVQTYRIHDEPELDVVEVDRDSQHENGHSSDDDDEGFQVLAKRAQRQHQVLDDDDDEPVAVRRSTPAAVKQPKKRRRQVKRGSDDEVWLLGLDSLLPVLRRRMMWTRI
jgi:hypothetical protein